MKLETALDISSLELENNNVYIGLLIKLIYEEWDALSASVFQGA